MYLPVECNSCQCENTGNNCVVGNKMIDCAINRSKWPVIIPHVDEVEYTIENGHQKVRERQVHQKIIGRRPHSFVA